MPTSLVYLASGLALCDLSLTVYKDAVERRHAGRLEHARLYQVARALYLVISLSTQARKTRVRVTRLLGLAREALSQPLACAVQAECRHVVWLERLALSTESFLYELPEGGTHGTQRVQTRNAFSRRDRTDDRPVQPGLA